MPTETITADTDWTVPDGVFAVTLTLEGERGGSDDFSGTDYGGPGGRVVGELEVRPGEVLYIRETPGGTGAADGGDAIDVRTSGTSLEDRIAIAAGGGAGGEGSQTGTAFGGAGGPATGADGENGSSGGTPPTGGTQSSGGAGSGDGSNGSFGAGGDAGTNDSNAGHGGGAGLFGGGGGESSGVFGGVGDSGAGGSNYVDGLDSVITNERGTSGRDHTDGGLVTIEYEPVAPENLTRSETTATSTTVTWDPPTLPPEVDSLDLYRVYRDLGAGSVRTDYAEVATRDPGQTTYDDVGLLNGRTYHYRVGADLTAPELDERDKPTAIPDSGVEDFESGTLDPQWVDTSYLSATTTRPWNGSYSGESDTGGSTISAPLYDWQFGGGNAYQLASFSMFYWEQSSGNGGEGWRFVDENNTIALGVASNNPQLVVEDNNGNEQVADPSWLDTEMWIKVDVSFDWGAGTFDVTWTDAETQSNSYVESGRPLISTSPVDTLRGQTYNGGWGAGPTVHWIDDLEVTI